MLKPDRITHIINKNLGLILLALSIVVSLFIFKDYGISWDEVAQRKTGTINYNYVFSNDNELLDFYDKDYGVAFELPLIIIEKSFNLTDSRDIYLMRHLVAHLFFLVGAFFLFKLVDFLSKNKVLASIAFLLIVLNPILYAHSYFNSKDVPFMAMFIICFYYTAIAFHKKSIVNFAILGICLGLLINLRIMGSILLCSSLAFLMMDFIRNGNFKNFLKFSSVLIISTFIFLYISWPYLWLNPFENFYIAFKNMSHFRWESTLLYYSEMTLSTELPWTYIPVWFGITNPVIYLFIGIFGVILLMIHFIQNPDLFFSNSKQRNNLLYLFCFLAPVLLVIVLHSVLYDSWRQLYFIYPAFVLLSIYFLEFLYRKNKFIPILLTAVAFILALNFMIRSHPYQNVFFNQLVNHDKNEHLRKTFEMDYWGTSFKEALEYLVAKEDSDTILVSYSIDPGEHNALILPKNQRDRIKFVSVEESEYFITNYRWHPEDYEEYKRKSFFKIKVGHNTINEIFKLK